MATSEPQQPEWELRKENAAPLARGRNASTLSRALSSSSQVDDDTRRRNDKRLRQYERLVSPSEQATEMVAERADAGDPVGKDIDPMTLLDEEEQERGDDADDPLIHWLSYIKFHQEAYPSDTRAQFLLMERCARTIVAFPRYRDDVRFVRVCVLYADKTSSPSDIFKFLHQKGVGSRTALFWIAWAWVAEKAEDYRFAEKVFNKGISKKAKPLKMLEQRHKQFQRRMSRHWLNNTTLDQASIDPEGEAAAAEARGRGTLSGLTEGGVRRNHRSRSSNSDLSFSSGMQLGNNGHGWAHHQQPSNNSTSTATFSTRRPGSSSARARPNSVVAKAGFSIFVDENDESGGGYDLNRSRDGQDDGGHGGSSNRIATESDRVKENEGRTERWNERGGLGGDHEGNYAGAEDEGGVYVRFQHAQLQQHRPSAPTFDVFVDDECAAENEHKEQELQKQREKKRKDAEGDGRSLRQRMDGGVADRLQRDPLRYMRNPSKQSSDKAKYGDDVASSAKKAPRRDDSRPPRSNSKRSAKKPATTNNNKLPLGFNKNLCEKDANGHECCFEEARARARYYRLVSPDEDFNLLHVETTALVAKHDDSAMDVDSSSIIDVDMDVDDDNDVEMESESAHDSPTVGATRLDVSVHHKSGFNSSDVNGTGIESSRKAPMPKRVLFGGLDSSVCSQPTPKNISQVSAASSTVDERHATGVVNMGKEEETINTKFAMRELSMMFASPAVDGGADDSDAGRIGGGDGAAIMGGHGDEDCPSASKPLFSVYKKVRCNLTPPSEAKSSDVSSEPTDGNTATFSVVADLINGAANDEVEEKSVNKKKPFGEVQATFKEAMPMEQEENIAEEEPKPIAGGSGGFEIFVDKNEETSSSMSAAGAEAGLKGGVEASSAPFTIFQDPTAIIGENDIAAAMAGTNVTTHNYDSSDDDDSTSSCEDEDGNTATFGEIGEAFKDLVAAAEAETGCKEPTSKRTRPNRPNPRGKDNMPPGSKAASGFAIFCDDGDDTENKISPREHNLNDEDTRNVFGADIDISRIAPASPENTISTCLLPETSIEYRAHHERDVKNASRRIFSDRTASVIDYRSANLPVGFRGNKPVRGAEIDMDDVTAVCQHELGRGANGVVLLCHSKCGDSFSSDEYQRALALKVQSPTGCLAWEHQILAVVAERVPPQDIGDSRSKHRGSRKRQGSIGRKDAIVRGHSHPFPRPFSFVAFKNGALLGMTAGSSSGLNLVDLVNYYRKSGEGAVPELLAIHYTARMLKHLEVLHWHGHVLHCDVKPDNWVLVPSSCACGAGNDTALQGSEVMLVDWGRAIDLRAAAKNGDPLDVRFYGNAAAADMECVAMREGLAWGLDTDTYGLCASAFTMLFGSHMEIVKDRTTKKWRLKKPLRRYWQKSLWENLFGSLLVCDGSAEGALGSHPNGLRAIRREFEAYLDEGSRRAQVVMLLRQQATILPSKK